MTQLSDKDRKAQMADMKSFDEQMPCVGSLRASRVVTEVDAVNTTGIDYSNLICIFAPQRHII